ncbi:hypothetical protein TQ32_02610 [Pyrococcus kukulkanii]|uniref:Uncharacterized protein n=2 Tax=Pyrococcus kukulkanii TaxID=1609559 RepID=A0A127B802_9EURY|nr:hypothetical protein TQ32_02610 [Pyrococcus kukulkanii]
MRVMEYSQHVINIVLLVLALFSVNFIVNNNSKESMYVLGVVVLTFFIIALLYILITNAILLVFNKVHSHLLVSSKDIETLVVNLPKDVEERTNKLFKIISISMSSTVLLVVMNYFISDNILYFLGYKVISIKYLNRVFSTKWILILGKPLLAVLISYCLWERIMKPVYKLMDSYDHFLRDIWITVYPPFIRISKDPYKTESVDIIIQDVSPKKDVKIRGKVFVRFPQDIEFYEGSIFNELIKKQEFSKNIELSYKTPFVEIKLIPIYRGDIKKTGVITIRIEFENGIVRNHTIGAKLVPE